MNEPDKVICPRCEKEELEFNFVGNNGYIAICSVCQVLLYYCSLLGKATIFKPTGEHIEMSWKEICGYVT